MNGDRVTVSSFFSPSDSAHTWFFMFAQRTMYEDILVSFSERFYSIANSLS